MGTKVTEYMGFQLTLKKKTFNEGTEVIEYTGFQLHNNSLLEKKRRKGGCSLSVHTASSHFTHTRLGFMAVAALS